MNNTVSHYVHNINPNIIDFGFLQIRWYGMMYLIAFVSGYLILKYRRKKGWFQLTSIEVQDLITYLMVGMMLGARVFYVFIYNWEYYQDHLSEFFMLWKGGLSFHGAALGFTIGIYFYCKKHKKDFWHVADGISICGPWGIFLGRLGNYTNGELWGRHSDVPWAMIFPTGGPLPRHPSQLYQAFGEGLAVFLILLLIDKYERKKYLSTQEVKKTTNVKWNRTGVISGFCILLYGVFRFIVEFYRQPDAQLGFYLKYFSMGQILCCIMWFIGAAMIYKNIKHPKSAIFKV